MDSSAKAWAIVPPKPKELMPPLADGGWRSVPCAFSTVFTFAPSAAPTRKLSTRSCAFGDARELFRCEASFSNPVLPAAGSEWPKLPLPLPRASNILVIGRTAMCDPASMGSPSAVPVPCASAHLDLSSPELSRPRAASRSACCAWPLGAVKLAERPT